MNRPTNRQPCFRAVMVGDGTSDFVVRFTAADAAPGPIMHDGFGIAISGRCDDEEIPAPCQREAQWEARAKSYARRARSITDPGGEQSQECDHRNGRIGAGGGTVRVPALWVAEHHSTEAFAGTTPEILVAHLAAATSTLRHRVGGCHAQSLFAAESR